jgi:hypothetical protein
LAAKIFTVPKLDHPEYTGAACNFRIMEETRFASTGWKQESKMQPTLRFTNFPQKLFAAGKISSLRP